MTKKKQTQNQTQNVQTSNTFGWVQPPDNDDFKAIRGYQFTADPSISYRYAAERNRYANSLSDPTGGGAYFPPEMRRRVTDARNRELMQAESAEKSAAHQQLQGQQFAQRAAVAQLTSPRLVQTSGSSTGSMSGTTTQSGGLLGDIFIGAASGAGQGAGAAA
jgi:hypothetical protein